ncbi:threonine-phosphate decarboxylase [Halococcus sp. AFM35]|uniref:threonine-phosphate decarboxylase n=1 Tax=Halococcus sp. AFM35 TaxID=3421653 RepID=UPI003EC0E5B3
MRRETVRHVGREPHGSSDDADVLDFSANTNPCLPDGVEDVYREAFTASRSYPPEPPTEYCEAAAEYVGCDSEHVTPTPGGLAAIRLTIELAVGEGDSVLVPYPSFAEYAREVRLRGGEPSFVPQDRILEADPAGHALAIVCNPNNPTGNAYDTDALSAFAARCRGAGTPLLADEAFLGFTDRPSLAGTDGVVVARSLTKLFGLPGLRAGFAVATGAFDEALAIARRPWNVSAPALATGSFCMTREEFVAATRERVRTERNRMQAALSGAFDVYPSDAPFVLFDIGDREVEELLHRARDHGLALRDATTFRGLDSHIRVAVRRPEENDRLLEALDV